MTPETLLSKLADTSNEKTSSLMKELKSAVRCCFVEEFPKGSERPCESSDFAEMKKFQEVHVSNMKLIFDKITENNYFHLCKSNCVTPDECKRKINIDNDLLSLIVIMCGENIERKPWNTEETVKNCESILLTTLKLFECDSVFHLISKSERRSVVKNILRNLRPRLLNNTWKHFPASVLVYTWILQMIKQPDMSSYLPLVLPTALLLVDDFVNENRINGVKCLHHIINNVTAAELQFYAHGDVIYGALLPLIRVREADVLSTVLPCLASLTAKLEINFGKKDVTKWSKFDDILEIYLENVELEQFLDLRNCYMGNLELLIVSSGISVIRWSKRLLRIFREYIQIAARHSDENTMNCCLKAIEKYLEIAHPVTHLFGENLLFTLLIPLYYSLNKTGCRKVLEEQKVLINCIRKLIESFTESEKEKIKEQLNEKFSDNTEFLNLYNLVENC